MGRILIRFDTRPILLIRRFDGWLERQILKKIEDFFTFLSNFAQNFGPFWLYFCQKEENHKKFFRLVLIRFNLDSKKSDSISKFLDSTHAYCLQMANFQIQKSGRDYFIPPIDCLLSLHILPWFLLSKHWIQHCSSKRGWMAGWLGSRDQIKTMFFLGEFLAGLAAR